MHHNTSESELLQAVADTLTLAITADQIRSLLDLRTLLLDWNSRMNLTAITAPEDVLARHIVDSLTCLAACDGMHLQHSVALLDVGSGAGFPGLVLAIVCPHWQIVLLEATAKKARFQQAVIDELHLTNVRCVTGRAETYAHDVAMRGQFAVVTARALAALPTLLEWCQPFAQVGGIVIASKKGDIADELAQGRRAATMLGGMPPTCIAVPDALTALVPSLADGRVLVRVQQAKTAPARYPRAGGAPAKNPLGKNLSNKDEATKNTKVHETQERGRGGDQRPN